MFHSHCAAVTQMNFRNKHFYNVVTAQMKDYPRYNWSGNICANSDDLTVL